MPRAGIARLASTRQSRHENNKTFCRTARLLRDAVRPVYVVDNKKTRKLTGTDQMARVALVTGGTRGIGASIAVGLKNCGHTVAAN